MSGDVRAALDAAGEAVRVYLDKNGCGEVCALRPCRCADGAAAAAIAAFLRALPGCDVMLQRWTDDDPPQQNGPHSNFTLAAAVTAAAREGSE